MSEIKTLPINGLRTLNFILLMTLGVANGCKWKSAINPNSSPKIVGGGDVTQRSGSFALIKIVDGPAQCGGSFIAPDVVLTAAHCIYQIGQPIEVIFDPLTRSEWTENGRKREVLAATYHDHYNPKTWENDVGLVFLKPDSTKSVAVRPMNYAKTLPVGKLENANLVVTGFGSASSAGTVVLANRQEINVPYVPRDRCQTGYKDLDIRDGMFCAGNIDLGGKDSCHGDSGGPLMIRKDGESDLQVGIVSWGAEACAQPGRAGVYTNVSLYADWIASAMAEFTQSIEKPSEAQIKRLVTSYCYASPLPNFIREQQINGSVQFLRQSRVSWRAFSTATPEQDKVVQIKEDTNLVCKFTSQDQQPYRVAKINGQDGTYRVFVQQTNSGQIWEANLNEVEEISFRCGWEGGLFVGESYRPSAQVLGQVLFFQQVFDVVNARSSNVKPSSGESSGSGGTMGCEVDGKKIQIKDSAGTDGTPKKVLEVSPGLVDGEHQVFELTPSDPKNQQTAVDNVVILTKKATTQKRNGDLVIENKMKNTIYTWMLDCSNPFRLTTRKGEAFESKTEQGPHYSLIVQSNQSTVGIIKSGEVLSFAMEMTDPGEQGDFLKAQCSFNNLPYDRQTWIIQAP